CQVAVEALGGSRAEGAVEAATDLRGHAQGAAPLVGDVHGLDGVLAIGAHRQQPLVGAVGGGLVEHDVGDDDLGMRMQLGAQRLAEVGHLVEVGDIAVVDPLHHLVGAVALLAEGFLEEALQALAVQLQEVLLPRSRGLRQVRARGRRRGDRLAGGGHAGDRLQSGHVFDLLLQCAQRDTTSVAAKKYATSMAAFSTESEPWAALASMDSAKSARMVPGAASFGLVAPSSSRCLSTAFSPSRTWIITGPEIMNSTSALKNGRSRCTA